MIGTNRTNIPSFAYSMTKNTEQQSHTGEQSLFAGRITFDRFVRGLLILMGGVGVYYLLNILSSVLLPFFLAWLIAYLLYPLITFLEKKCRIRFRILSIVVALALVFGILAALVVFTIPPAIKQIGRLSDDLILYATTYLSDTDIPNQLLYLAKDFDSNTIIQLFQNDEVMDAIRTAIHQFWSLISGTINVAWILMSIMMTVLYLIFLLIDYENINTNWIQIVPHTYRKKALSLTTDMKHEMNAYFRGQATVALLVGILFSIGFIIIDFPMAIGLGLFIGLLNMVPYAQTLGIIPTIILGLLKANDTGQSFWIIALMTFAVFCVVQAIQDLILVPKIMGKTMGLKPAIILLSLSIWGTLLGIVGFIIALPLTTLAWSYYKRYVLKEE
jgi:predicted PurR-regulated permease PerM